MKPGEGSDLKRMKSWMKIACGGTIIAKSTSRNNLSRPGNWKRAKPYPATAQDRVCSTAATPASSSVFLKERGYFSAWNTSL